MTSTFFYDANKTDFLNNEKKRKEKIKKEKIKKDVEFFNWVYDEFDEIKYFTSSLR